MNAFVYVLSVLCRTKNRYGGCVTVRATHATFLPNLALVDGLVVPPRVENVECPLLIVLHVRVTPVLHFLEMFVLMVMLVLLLMLMVILSLPPPPPVVPVASPRLFPLRHLHGDSEMDLIHRLEVILHYAALQGTAKRWSPGCVNSASKAR